MTHSQCAYGIGSYLRQLQLSTFYVNPTMYQQYQHTNTSEEILTTTNTVSTNGLHSNKCTKAETDKEHGQNTQSMDGT
jgi:hypothetical protein